MPRGATLYVTDTFGADEGIVIGPGFRLICAAIAALGIAFALGWPVVPPGLSVSWGSLGSQTRDSGGLPVASLTEGRASSAEYSSLDPRAGSFDERFGGAFDWPSSRHTTKTEEPEYNIPLRSPDLGGHTAAGHGVGQSARDVRPVPASPPASVSKKQLRVAAALDESISPPEVDDHTAIYDIAAHRVYLPNGQKLEAHSGLGGHLDDPRYVSEKDRGPTPPNLYDLSLREELFHGVRAIRLNPVGGGNMFGRDGMLAHSYMLGPNGQSNGCVSFRDYPAFLNAFLNGEVNRLVVVEHLATAPSSKTASGWMLPETIKALFGRS